MKYTLIGGSGRIARHLHTYFSMQNQSASLWSRTDGDDALQTLIANSDVVLVLIPDDAIADFVRERDFLRAKPLVHMSGSRDIDGIYGFHPLCSFGPQLFKREFYERIPFVTRDDAAVFKDLFPQLPNPVFFLRENKAFYHAWCVLAANVPVLLWQNYLRRAEEWGLSGDAAQVLLESVWANWNEHPSQALTGPFVRGDVRTLDKDLQGLKDREDPWQNVFESVAKVYRRM